MFGSLNWHVIIALLLQPVQEREQEEWAEEMKSAAG